MNHRFKHAFSLVELSIVLVILGLLAGGILSGQSLIRAAQTRSISTDLARFQTAMFSFRDKYSAIPGDMTNATAFWSAADTDAATCKTTASTGKATCNGNGDGWICSSDGGCGSHRNGDWYERYRTWQHLANAGLIEGSYSGVDGGNNAWHHVAGKNSPASKITGATYALFGTKTITNVSTLWDGDYGNVIEFRNNDATNWVTLLPEEMWNIDTKLDDGRPGSGSVVSYKPAHQANCATDATSYKLLHTSAACSIIFKLGI
jgi:prepilin-type N-terminal cleavage/methylation domain-containing protein